MTVEYLPSGIKCNLKCTYCYQEPMREAGNFSVPLNFVRVKEALKKTNTSFSLFGGEPMLTPIEHLEEIWKYGFEQHHSNGIQTNGTIVTDKHIDLFRRYRVHVGVSIDGPGEANSARCGLDDTEKIINNIKLMTAEGVGVSLIITIHRKNADHLRALLNFFKEMEAIGVTQINLHNLEVDNRDTDNLLKLSDEENFLVFKAIYDHYRDTEFNILPFHDIKTLLTNPQPSVSCVWTGCDPLSTPAVHGINAEGSLINCGRTNKTGIDYIKAKDWNQERYVALATTPQEHGGCKDCRYLYACKGNCPGTAIDGDWRNRTVDCVFWYKLIEYIEHDLISQGTKLLDIDECNKTFVSSIYQQDQQHGDVPHGDSHGDHTDTRNNRARPGKGICPTELGV
jgi:uncharacterized protein